MGGYAGGAIDSGICKEYYHGVRMLDEIDNRWPHAARRNISRPPFGGTFADPSPEKSNAYMKERPYERNPPVAVISTTQRMGGERERTC